MKTLAQKPLRNRSLHDVMNELVQTPGCLLPEKNFLPPVEEDAFAMIDPLLAHLRKQMLGAQAQYGRLRKLRGGDDAMTAVAADMADSARSAFETRLIEVRRNRQLAKEARRLMKRAEDEAYQKRQERSILHQMQLQLFYEDYAKTIKEKHKREAHERRTWLLFLMWLIQISTPRSQFALSLGRDFSTACTVFDDAA
jgi:hypothetical protein